mgnify:FL=1|jgi:hypothetical protein
MKKIENIYADYEHDSDDMFVVTPEGNRYTFPAPEYTDKHDPEIIVDTTSHIQYNVIFDE